MLITSWVLCTFHRVVTHDAYRHGFEFPYMSDPKHRQQQRMARSKPLCKSAVVCNCLSQLPAPIKLVLGLLPATVATQVKHVLVANQVLCTSH